MNFYLFNISPLQGFAGVSWNLISNNRPPLTGLNTQVNFSIYRPPLTGL